MPHLPRSHHHRGTARASVVDNSGASAPPRRAAAVPSTASGDLLEPLLPTRVGSHAGIGPVGAASVVRGPSSHHHAGNSARTWGRGGVHSCLPVDVGFVRVRAGPLPVAAAPQPATSVVLLRSGAPSPHPQVRTGAHYQLSDDLKLCVRHQSGATKTRLSFETVREIRCYCWPRRAHTCALHFAAAWGHRGTLVGELAARTSLRAPR